MSSNVCFDTFFATYQSHGVAGPPPVNRRYQKKKKKKQEKENKQQPKKTTTATVIKTSNLFRDRRCLSIHNPSDCCAQSYQTIIHSFRLASTVIRQQQHFRTHLRSTQKLWSWGKNCKMLEGKMGVAMYAYIIFICIRIVYIYIYVGKHNKHVCSIFVIVFGVGFIDKTCSNKRKMKGAWMKILRGSRQSASCGVQCPFGNVIFDTLKLLSDFKEDFDLRGGGVQLFNQMHII